jgi:hypothetical protein
VKINRSAFDAEDLIAERYRHASKPLTKMFSDNPHKMENWTSAAKAEGGSSERKFIAIPFYIELAGASRILLPPNSFPAVFEFWSKEVRYPDKGLIKALLSNGLIEGQIFTYAPEDDASKEELIFILTEQGRAQFLDHAEA